MIVETELSCPDCCAPMELRQSRYGQFYGCTNFPDCRGTHGAHPDGTPLGKPGDREVKQWRIKAHAAFDKFWKSEAVGFPSRNKARGWAYRWLQEQMGLSGAECHIGLFDVEQCKRVVEVCTR